LPEKVAKSAFLEKLVLGGWGQTNGVCSLRRLFVPFSTAKSIVNPKWKFGALGLGLLLQ